MAGDGSLYLNTGANRLACVAVGMKIAAIRIELVPSKYEQREPVALYRDADKMWRSDRLSSGILPFETRLIAELEKAILVIGLNL